MIYQYQARGERLDLLYKGGDSVTVLETIALPNLLAVVVFCVISAMTKK